MWPKPTALLRSRLCLTCSYARILSIGRCFEESPTSASRTHLLRVRFRHWGQPLIARRVLGPGDDRRWLSTAEARYCGGMGMTLNIPDSVLQGLRIPEGEIAQRLRSELAIALYVLRSAIARQGRRTRGGES